MKLTVCLMICAVGAGFTRDTLAGTVLADDFASSTLNSATPAAPTGTSTAYHLFSSKSWNPSPSIGLNDLRFGIAPTTSGHIEVQALFATTPVALTNVGDWIELSVTFTNTSGLFDLPGHVGFGLYNSGGVPPLSGGMNGTATTSTTNLTGGAQGWQGYVSRVAYSGGNHRIATRPAQTITTGNNQDLVTEGSGSMSYAGGVNLASVASTFTQATGSPLTKVLRYTLTAASTLQIDSQLFSGADTNGALLVSQSASASGANFLTNSFDALCVGWRATANTAATLMDLRSIRITTSSAGGGTTNPPSAQVPAFPGAEGAGAFATGGRGGDVYYVTTLADSGTGSFRTGVSTAPAGGRTICFKVSGNIELNSTMTINKPNITVAGQTAPGDGICFQDYSLNIAANNVIVRHLRTRLGTNALQEADCMWINSGTNIIVDHVSASWSVDEVLSSSRTVANLTVQNSFITESLNNSIHSKGAHGYGGIISSGFSTNYSYLRNLYAHNNSRNPRIGSDSQTGTLRLDFRNNVIYNYGGRAGYTGGADESCEVNYVGNYCIKGASSTYNYILEGGALTTHVFQDGNYIDLNRNGLVDGANTGWTMFSGTYTQTNAPFDVPSASTETAPTAYQRVVALSGAMPWRRDANDQRIARTVRQQNGTIIDAVAQVGTWPTLVAEPPPVDTDSDGMPDYWELAVGLNPNLASDRNLTNAATGYTRLEDYLNWLAEAHAICDRNGSVDVSLRQATGNASNLTYTVANGVNGSVSLLADGYTARFSAAANTNGLAGFTFTATDPATAVSFGPVSYGILISITNAPVSNTPPVLAPIPDRTVLAGSNLTFTCSVTDTDAPPQTITFSLQSAPPGASLGANDGVFIWRPTMAQSPSTNAMSIVAMDSGTPALSATQSFSIVVVRPTEPILQQPVVQGGALQLAISGDAGPDYTVQASTNLTDWVDLLTTNSPVLPFTWSDTNTAAFPERFYRVLLGP